MSDANSKPVAGASEPHELEERADNAWVTERGNWMITEGRCRVYSMKNAHEDDLPVFSGSHQECESFVRALCLRAVLNLVRQEQEKWTMAIHANGIEWWWEPHISHTAKETSNG